MLLLILLCSVSNAAEEHTVVGTRTKDVVLECLLRGSITLPEWHGPPDYEIYSIRGSPDFNKKIPSIADGRLSWKDDNNKRDIVIKDVRPSDAGHYQCLYPGVNAYQIELVVNEIVEVVSPTPGLHSTPGSSHTGVIVAVVISLLWIFICTLGIIVVKTKYCNYKFLSDMAEHLKLSCHKRSKTCTVTVFLVVSCYILIGWIILIYKVMSKRNSDTLREARTAAEGSGLPLITNVSVGIESQKDEMGVKTAPTAPPHSIVVKAINFNSIGVNWKPPPYEHQHGQITSYNVYYSTDDGKTGDPVVKEVNGMEVTLHNLESSSAYHIQVQAVNLAGVGKLSAPFKVTTFSYAPDAPPELVLIQPLSYSSIFVKWAVPADHQVHSNIEGYKVCYKANGVSSDQKVAVSVLEIALSNLEPSTEYTIEVLAYNSGGASQCSKSAAVTTFSYELDAFKTDPKMSSIYVEAEKTEVMLDRHLQIIIVGNSGHGKSSLTHRLLGKSVHDVDNTQKIVFHSNYCSENNNGIWEPNMKSLKPEMSGCTNNKITLCILDFNGQYLFKTACHLFHGRNVIYLVVFDLERCEDSRNVENILKKEFVTFWEDSIQLLLGTGEKHPAILYVGTHKDKLKSPVAQHPSLYAVNNIKIDDSEITSWRKLRKDIEETFKNLKRSVLPKDWIALEEAIMGFQGDSILKLETILEINASLDTPLKSTDEVKVFLQSCHHRGIFSYFNEPNLQYYVIRNPDCLLNAFQVIAKAESLCKKSPRHHLLWDRLVLEGCLENELLDVIWAKNEYLKANKEILINFLQRYHILTRVFHITENNTKEYFSFYVVPSWLKKRFSHKNLITFKNSRDKVKFREETGKSGKAISHKELKIISETSSSLISMVYAFKGESNIFTVYQRLTAVALGLWPLVEIKNKHLLCDWLSMYELGECYVGVISVYNGCIELRLMNRRKEMPIDGKYGDKFRRVVDMTLKQEFSEFNESQKMYTLSLRCLDRCHGENGGVVLHIFENAKNHSSMSCQDKNHEIQMKEALAEWYVDLGAAQSFLSSQTLSDDVCSELAVAITGDWNKFATSQLNLEKGCVEQIEMNYKYSRTIQAFKILQSWRNKQMFQTSPAAFAALIQAMNDCNYITVDWDHIKNILDGF